MSGDPRGIHAYPQFCRRSVRDVGLENLRGICCTGVLGKITPECDPAEFISIVRDRTLPDFRVQCRIDGIGGQIDGVINCYVPGCNREPGGGDILRFYVDPVILPVMVLPLCENPEPSRA